MTPEEEEKSFELTEKLREECQPILDKYPAANEYCFHILETAIIIAYSDNPESFLDDCVISLRKGVREMVEKIKKTRENS